MPMHRPVNNITDRKGTKVNDNIIDAAAKTKFYDRVLMDFKVSSLTQYNE
uniref:Uncharacterized protein n=1 Tax=Rhizophora mucronata TaxID=61149 RepID=A0A2P2QIW1_RHIMU